MSVHQSSTFVFQRNIYVVVKFTPYRTTPFVKCVMSIIERIDFERHFFQTQCSHSKSKRFCRMFEWRTMLFCQIFKFSECYRNGSLGKICLKERNTLWMWKINSRILVWNSLVCLLDNTLNCARIFFVLSSLVTWSGWTLNVSAV